VLVWGGGVRNGGIGLVMLLVWSRKEFDDLKPAHREVRGFSR
jgi:hypothetical protein